MSGAYTEESHNQISGQVCFTCPYCGHVGKIGNPPEVWRRTKAFSLVLNCEKCKESLTVVIVGDEVKVGK